MAKKTIKVLPISQHPSGLCRRNATINDPPGIQSGNLSGTSDVAITATRSRPSCRRRVPLSVESATLHATTSTVRAHHRGPRLQMMRVAPADIPSYSSVSCSVPCTVSRYLRWYVMLRLHRQLKTGSPSDNLVVRRDATRMDPSFF